MIFKQESNIKYPYIDWIPKTITSNEGKFILFLSNTLQLILEEPPKEQDIHEANDIFKLLIDEINRLKNGNFTEEEFQNLCHNFSPDDKCRFQEGCREYQKKLFGE